MKRDRKYQEENRQFGNRLHKTLNKDKMKNKLQNGNKVQKKIYESLNIN